MKDLALIMPVYNEEEAIKNVIEIWIDELNKYDIDYNIIVYNDGSKDKTFENLNNLVKSYQQLVVIDKINSGHGPTVLQGYKEQCDKYNWIFQIDSDNEMGNEGFKHLWEKRANYDFLIGTRDNRIQPLARKIISLTSRLTIRLFYGKNGPYDVNSPYRLMRTDKFKNLYNIIPEDTFAPNVIISGFVANKHINFYEYPVECKLRQTGEVSIKNFKLFKAAVKSFMQTIKFSRKIKGI